MHKNYHVPTFERPVLWQRHLVLSDVRRRATLCQAPRALDAMEFIGTTGFMSQKHFGNCKQLASKYGLSQAPSPESGFRAQRHTVQNPDSVDGSSAKIGHCFSD